MIFTGITTHRPIEHIFLLALNNGLFDSDGGSATGRSPLRLFQVASLSGLMVDGHGPPRLRLPVTVTVPLSGMVTVTVTVANKRRLSLAAEFLAKH